ncbi:Cas9 inhibitor AcrIIA9 family protein [Candidatus Contubernalis alkaliaceticus]|uniref:Cas9 inhibitor AcrIIA9 family protein n=1 Tax=Candidatus Contubernalis alkaliaceticus TaxID=338645 RepID=UPI001F4C2BAB|nr:Cas9 inhibitor AcrIIA9 family protein [Candidatus Contubernalis alkalaceticus]UNC91677.1 hypothetical protein HUE98_05965 [Candidatus Contubernalis alkalaceticus]
MEKALEKLKTEMDGDKNNKYVQVVGEFLIEYLNNNPQAAEQILAEGKTIKGSLVEMKEEARKHQVDGCGVLTDQEGFEVALKYFEIEQGAPVVSKLVTKNSNDFDVSLDDFLS